MNRSLVSPLGNHPIDWNIVHLRDITIKIGSGATPTGGQDTYLFQREKFALIRSQNVYDRRFDEDGLAFLTDDQAQDLLGVVLKKGDILLNITGDGITFSRSCLVPENILPAVVNQHVSIIRVDEKQADSGFILAYLTHPSIKKYIESFNAGGSRRAITKGHIESFIVPLPPLPTQHAIACILGSLDDKIELNRQMNETLEAMVRAIFQSWFVDFDPVRAKAEGRDTGLPPEVAALFPSEFVEVDGWEMPKGWGVGTISDLSDITSGKRPENSEPVATTEKLIPLYGGGGIMGYVATPLFHQSILLTGRVGTLGEIFRITSPCWASDNTLIIISKVPEFYEYLYYQLRSFDFNSLNRGSTQPLVTQNDLKAQEILIPIQEILKKYHQIVKPFFEKIDKNNEQFRTLAQIRDALLPKLMSGEIQIDSIT